MTIWSSLVSAKRLGFENRHYDEPEEIRTAFQRDYDRIIFSSPFRRLQKKTQVFPLPGSIFVHNRLTHSLEVASVGRSLGHLVAQGLGTLLGSLRRPFWIREIPSQRSSCPSFRRSTIFKARIRMSSCKPSLISYRG